MPLMPSLVSHIYGSSGDNFNEKSERVTILAFKVTFGKFSFLQVKIHINAYKFHFGQNFLGPSCFLKYGCAEYRCPKRATGEAPYDPIPVPQFIWTGTAHNFSTLRGKIDPNQILLFWSQMIAWYVTHLLQKFPSH